MKKSAVIILMVALFSANAFAGQPACKYAAKKVPLFSDSNEVVNTNTSVKAGTGKK